MDPPFVFIHNNTWNISILEGYLESLKGESITKFKISNFNSFIVTV